MSTPEEKPKTTPEEKKDENTTSETTPVPEKPKNKKYRRDKRMTPSFPFVLPFRFTASKVFSSIYQHSTAYQLIHSFICSMG